MKGMTIGSGAKRPTKKGAGLSAKGVAKYRRQNPGSKLQTAVTEKKPKGKRCSEKKELLCSISRANEEVPEGCKES